MSDKSSEFGEMSALIECQSMMRQLARPAEPGESVKAVLLRVCRKLPGWSYSRVRDVWYADDRVRVSGDELRDIERAARDAANEKAAKDEFKQLDARIARLEAQLALADEDFHRPSIDALGEMARRPDRTMD